MTVAYITLFSFVTCLENFLVPALVFSLLIQSFILRLLVEL